MGRRDVQGVKKRDKRAKTKRKNPKLIGQRGRYIKIEEGTRNDEIFQILNKGSRYR